ncbi:MAG: sugar transferase [Erythrobacter sp.]|uniref:sugar transferase n=1 Tax=Erythrobacter sp. TaxID=1042 RepID=UPI0026334467|nr:sugar transferase [Erythrobacter sp.]MDJ0978679.1 sugar transferase [Erythrobacter sp.]
MTSIIARPAALLTLLALSPLLIALFVACALAQGRPVMFRQLRAGQHKEPFELLKFRSMRDTRDSHGELMPDEERVTTIGTFLRRSRLDELPGLVNVVRGEMAFVGPRPLLPETIEDLDEKGLRRCQVKPGLTGLSQVSGNTLLTLDQKVDLDLWYIQNRSALLDAKIVLLTIYVMVAGEKVKVGTT